MHGNYRPLRQNIQVGIGDDGRNLDDAVLLGDKTGHLHIDPYQIMITDRHQALLSNQYMTLSILHFIDVSRAVQHAPRITSALPALNVHTRSNAMTPGVCGPSCAQWHTLAR